MSLCRLPLVVWLLLAAAVPPSLAAEPPGPALYAGLRWRMIGPFRGGRTVGATGVHGRPNVFYVGVNNGGVWKTTDAGRTWAPIFDDQPAGGKTFEQPLTVKMDPRVKAPAEVLARQFELSSQCYADVRQAREALGRVRKLRSQIVGLKAKAGEGALADALAGLDRKAAALEGVERRRGERAAGGAREPTMAGLAAESQHLLDVLQGADAAPTTQAVTACADVHKGLRDLLARWDELTGQDVKALNERLRGADLPPLDP